MKNFKNTKSHKHLVYLDIKQKKIKLGTACYEISLIFSLKYLTIELVYPLMHGGLLKDLNKQNLWGLEMIQKLVNNDNFTSQEVNFWLNS